MTRNSAGNKMPKEISEETEVNNEEDEFFDSLATDNESNMEDAPAPAENNDTPVAALKAKNDESVVSTLSDDTEFYNFEGSKLAVFSNTGSRESDC